MERFPITRSGFEALSADLKNLIKVERPKVIQAIATAREFGDLSENAEYAAAKEQQRMIENKIMSLEDKVARAAIIDIANLSGETVKFGASVKLVDDETEEEVVYQIVGEYEADIKKKLISISSPLAKALISKRIGDCIEFSTPKGTKGFEIIDVMYG